MIPILYESKEEKFDTDGIGRTTECSSCTIQEKLNGQLELEMEYPITGALFSDIKNQRIIMAVPEDGKDQEPFRIYKMSEPLNGIVTVSARHISYDLSGIPVAPFSATGITRTFQGLKDKSLVDNPFTFWSDISNDSSPYTQTAPASLRSRLGGVAGSLLDVFGGEYEWVGHTVKLHAHRGSDNGVSIRYGKNLTDIKQEENIESVYTGVLAYYQDSQTGNTVSGAVQYVSNHSEYPRERIFILDKSQDYSDTTPTAADLNADAVKYINSNNIGIPKINLDVSFAQLWQSDEYKDVAPLERVNLGDTVHIYFSALGVDAKAKVIKTTYDVLKERYTSIELGDAKSSLSDTLTEAASKEIMPKVNTTVGNTVSRATDLLSGGLGGHVVIGRNSQGQPNEILIMDTDDVATAVNVWRYNASGWGHSSTGYEGPYTMAATLDGGIVADYITAGTMSADRVKLGNRTLTETMSTVSEQIDTAQETANSAINGVTVQYALSDSSTTAPTDGWSATAPAWVDGKYMWERTVTNTSTGTSTSDPTNITGSKGAKGDTGADGKDGAQGVPGKAGADGKTPYLHTAYSWSADGTDRFMTVYPGENLYLNSKMITDVYGINRNATVTVETFDSTTNMWHIVAAQGNGNGIGIYMGGYATDKIPNNSDWSYSADIKGTGKIHMFGIENSDKKPVVGTVGSTWSRISQTGQLDNVKRKTIVMYFDTTSSPLDVYIKLPKLETGTPTPWTPSPLDDPEGAYPKFIGTYTDYTEADSTDPTKYTWSRFEGAQGSKGDQGIAGTNGTNGTTYYLHIAYANSADGVTGFSTTDSANKLYIGQCTNTTSADPTTPASYSWTKIKGATGIGTKAIVAEYFLSTSNTTQQDGDWVTTAPDYTAGKYYWTRSKITWTDDTVTYTDPVLSSGLNTANINADSANTSSYNNSKNIETIKNTVATSNTDVNKQLATIESSITQLSNSIAAKVSETDFEGFKTTMQAMLDIYGLHIKKDGTTKETKIDEESMSIIRSDGSTALSITDNDSFMSYLRVLTFLSFGSHRAELFSDTEYDGSTSEGTGFFWTGDVK